MACGKTLFFCGMRPVLGLKCRPLVVGLTKDRCPLVYCWPNMTMTNRCDIMRYTVKDNIKICHFFCPEIGGATAAHCMGMQCFLLEEVK